jgi:general stress protein YciG
MAGVYPEANDAGRIGVQESGIHVHGNFAAWVEQCDESGREGGGGE